MTLRALKFPSPSGAYNRENEAAFRRELERWLEQLAAGEQGPPGADGADGADGAPGEPGPPGEDATNAAVLLIHIDGGGAPITTGVKLDTTFPDFDCEITGWELVADQLGSIVIDLWLDSYANYPPTIADTITAAAKPTLAGAIKNRALSVPTWSPSISQGDTLRVSVDSATTVTRVTLALSLIKV